MEEKIITCIICPIGCTITVRGSGERIESVVGHTCARGETYARDEFIHPVRILTSTAKLNGVPGMPLIPVRSSKPIPKELLRKSVEEIRKLHVRPPVKRHAVLIENIFDTGADIIATGEAE